MNFNSLDDSQGKYSKASGQKTRLAVLSGAFIIGICLGFLASEKAYLWAQEADTPVAALQSIHSHNNNNNAADSRSSLFFHSFGNTDNPKGKSSSSLTTACSTSSNKKEVYTGQPRNELEKLLRQIAPKGEIMIAISNMNLIHETSLKLWLESVQKSGTDNYMVVAIDEQLRDYLQQHNVPVYYRPVVIPKQHEGTGDNHSISAMKYQIILEFLQLGWDVLLSDVDIVVVQNPWDHLHRDSDVEGMSDGFDPGSAAGEVWGIDDPTMGWSRYAQGIRHLAMNSGLFFLRSNERTIDFMTRLAARLEREKVWDQTAYNEEMSYYSYKERKAPQVSIRVMDIHKFMNSKVLFKFVRHMPKGSQPRPVMAHMNYHPNKSARMAAAMKYYFEGDDSELMAMPGGSEPGS